MFLRIVWKTINKKFHFSKFLKFCDSLKKLIKNKREFKKGRFFSLLKLTGFNV